MEEESALEIDRETAELRAAHHLEAIVAEAGQIYRGYSTSENGIDGEIEFREDDGSDSGQRLYVNFRDRAALFSDRLQERHGAGPPGLREPRLLDHWKDRRHTVMLVACSSEGPVRWMNLADAMGSALVSTHEDRRGVGYEDLTVTSVRRWRNRLLPGTLP